jgi:uncharacterized protein YhbP (UPF0306 family)
MDLNALAWKIISENIYLTLGTADGHPWVAPLFYAFNPVSRVFYFISQMDSLHTRHLLKNPRVAFAIFDSHQKDGTGNGIQGDGQVSLSEKELSEAFKYYHTTFVEMKPESFKDPAPYRFFKLVPEHLYLLDPAAKTDKRVEVKL